VPGGYAESTSGIWQDDLPSIAAQGRGFGEDSVSCGQKPTDCAVRDRCVLRWLHKPVQRCAVLLVRGACMLPPPIRITFRHSSVPGWALRRERRLRCGAADGGQGRFHCTFRHRSHQAVRLPASHVSGCAQAPMGVIPPPVMEKPWVDDHGAERGRPFGPASHCAILLPEPKTPLPVPAEAGHNRREHAAWNSGQQDRPVCQRHAISGIASCHAAGV